MQAYHKEIEEYFSQFIEKHCAIEKTSWIELKLLHTAFLDYLVELKIPLEWINKYVARNPSFTLYLSKGVGGIKKGTGETTIISGIKLLTYP